MLGVAACGHGSPGLSPRQFADQANAICARADAQVRAVPRPSSQSLSTLGPYLRGIEVAYQQSLDETGALAARAKDAKKIASQWITPARDDFAAVRPLYDQAAAAGARHDTHALSTLVSRLRSVRNHTLAVQTFQRSYGAGTCATLLDDIGT